MFPPSSLPLPGEVLLITDELLAPADFLLHRLLAIHLEDPKNSAGVLISVSGDIGGWKAIAGRSNPNLASYLDSGAFVVTDAMPVIASALESSEKVPLRRLYDQIRHALAQAQSEQDRKTLVIVDDVTSLEWIGISVEDISRFVRALCALSQQRNVAVVVRHHVVTAGEPDELFKRLVQACHWHMDVFPLSSGRSGAVSGQVALHCGPARAEPADELVTRTCAVQYRLMDSGSLFFDRGTGHGVL